MQQEKRDAATARVRDFYDGPADTIYKTTWGEHLHLGFPREKGRSQQDAMVYATERMASLIALDSDSSVLDLGSGYGGPARLLAARYGCRVTGLNLSKVEIEEARKRTVAQGRQSSITYVYGDFHDIPFPDTTFDVV